MNDKILDFATKNYDLTLFYDDLINIFAKAIDANGVPLEYVSGTTSDNHITFTLNKNIALRFANLLDDGEISIFAYPYVSKDKDDDIFEELSNRYFTNVGEDKEIAFLFKPIAHIVVKNKGGKPVVGEETSDFIVDDVENYFDPKTSDVNDTIMGLYNDILGKVIDFVPKIFYSKQSFLIKNYIQSRK